MQAHDDLAASVSLYQAEVERVRVLLEHGAGDVRCLVLLDEVFRGTNPTDRVAASGAVLLALGETNLVLAATHDLALAELTRERFDVAPLHRARRRRRRRVRLQAPPRPLHHHQRPRPPRAPRLPGSRRRPSPTHRGLGRQGLSPPKPRPNPTWSPAQPHCRQRPTPHRSGAGQGHQSSRSERGPPPGTAGRADEAPRGRRENSLFAYVIAAPAGSPPPTGPSPRSAAWHTPHHPRTHPEPARATRSPARAAPRARA